MAALMNTTPQADHVAVLLCPFCGGEPHFLHDDGAHVLGCHDCGYTLDSGTVGVGWFATEAEAIAAWNRRPTEAMQRQGEPVAWRYLRQVSGGVYAWTRWLGMDELHHYDAKGDLVDGPAPDWRVEYAYAAGGASR